MYGSSGQTLKMIVIELDGCLFSLNRYRFNFYKNLCTKKGISLSREMYYPGLGNMATMYDDLPLNETYDSASLNAKVESDLLNYMTLKGLQPNEGVKELLDYARSKGMIIVALSTHKTENAIAYLKMGELYHKIDFIIGSDTKLAAIPSDEMLVAILKKYATKPNEAVMVTSIRSILMTSKNLGMNVIYLKDLVEPTDYERRHSYAIADNMYEVLNDLIFGQYEDYSMYEPLLGMDEKMSSDDLDEVHYHLQHVFGDDQSLMSIINRTYEYKLSELSSSRRFVFDDEEEPLTSENVLGKGVTRQDVQRSFNEYPLMMDEDVSVIQEITPETRLKVAMSSSASSALTDVISQIMSQPPEPTFDDVEEVVDDDDDELTLIDQLAQEDDDEEEEEVITIKEPVKPKQPVVTVAENFVDEDDDDDEYEETLDLKDMIADSAFVILLSIFITFIGTAIFYVALQDLFDGGQLSFIAAIANAYMALADGLVGIVVRILHVIHLAPSFNEYLNANPIFSPFALHIFHAFILNCVVIVAVETIMSLFEDDDEITE